MRRFPVTLDGRTFYVRQSEDGTFQMPAELAALKGRNVALKPASEPIVVARKPLAGTVAQTVLAHGTGAINIDACRVPGDVPSTVQGQSQNAGHLYGADQRTLREFIPNAAGRWPSNVVLTHDVGCGVDGPCIDGCPVAELDAQSGNRRGFASQRHLSASKPGMFGVGDGADTVPIHQGYDDSGSASRFFPTFRYEAKADSAERPKVTGVAHPTVKPLALMRWLVRLVTSPGGTVLEPFAGSGTTVEACLREGFRCVAIEREADYLPLIDERIRRAVRPWQPSVNEVTAGDDEWTLFGGEAS